MTDTRPALNSCTYAHHPGVLHCEAQTTSAAVDPWAEFNLTQREVDVARLLARGVANKAIAAALVVEVRTIKGHVTHILKKTASANRTECALRLTLYLGAQS